MLIRALSQMLARRDLRHIQEMQDDSQAVHEQLAEQLRTEQLQAKERLAEVLNEVPNEVPANNKVTPIAVNTRRTTPNTTASSGQTYADPVHV
jgi:hypothetical protein